MKIKYTLIILLGSLIFLSCNENKESVNKDLENEMNTIAEKYVKIILKIGEHDADYVDAYYGPEEWKPDSTVKLESLLNEVDNTLDELENISRGKQATQIEKLRYRYLYIQLLSAKARIAMLMGTEFDFDEEAKALYDADPPEFGEDHFKNIIAKIDSLLPGDGDVTERLNKFKEDFIIPEDKLDEVFSAAIKECRNVTLKHIELPTDEDFEVEYVKDKPWGGYNWYKGNAYSLIQVNTDLPVYIDRAVDLAAHEGYPGHHVYNSMLEKKLVDERGWKEFTVYPLFSPQSLIAEGTANYGIDVVFPGDERIKFEKEVLFPLAGLDTSKAELYYKILELRNQLSYAGNEAARNYMNGEWTKEETKYWLIKFSLMTPEAAEKRISFIDKYGSYVINYNYGYDLVKEFIEASGGTADNPEKRWELFEFLISTPQTPSGIVVTDEPLKKITE